MTLLANVKRLSFGYTQVGRCESDTFWKLTSREIMMNHQFFYLDHNPSSLLVDSLVIIPLPLLLDLSSLFAAIKLPNDHPSKA